MFTEIKDQYVIVDQGSSLWMIKRTDKCKRALYKWTSRDICLCMFVSVSMCVCKCRYVCAHAFIYVQM